MKENRARINKTSWTLLAIAIGIIIYLSECTGTGECDPEIIKETTVDTMWNDTTPREVLVDVPYPVYKDTGTTRWREMDIDTMAILADYFSRYYYKDTITDDTSFLCVIMDTVSQNRIVDRRFIYQDLSPRIISTTTVNLKKRRKLFVGGMLGGSKTSIGAGGSLMFQSRRDHAYAYTYDAINKEHGITLYWKISLRRNKKAQ